VEEIDNPCMRTSVLDQHGSAPSRAD
jgi:hypothetical protein